MTDMRCFVDIHGVIYSLYDNGQSNFPHYFTITEDGKTLQVLGEMAECGDIAIDEEYTIWDSLTELAKQIEG